MATVIKKASALKRKFITFQNNLPAFWRYVWVFLAIFIIAGVTVLATTPPSGDFGKKLFVIRSCTSGFILLLAYAFFYFLSRRLWVSLCVVYTIMAIGAIINDMMILYRGDAFTALDIAYFREAANISSSYPVTFQMIFPRVIIFLALLMLALFTPKFRHKWAWVPLASGVLVIFTVSSFVFFSGGNESLFMQHVFRDHYVNSTKESTTNSFMLQFIRSIQRMSSEPPQGYSKQRVNDAAQALNYVPIDPDSFNQNANVIIIMNEAWWDVAYMDGIELNQDPLAPVRERLDTGEITGGRVLSPMFGGGTCAVEYEFLTGKSDAFLPTSAYMTLIKEPQWSLASYFGENGFHTQAIHPYHNWFWRRDRVYPLLGFDDSMFNDQFVDDDYKGYYVSDMAVAEKILETTKNESEPQFTFAVTMQNHGEYGRERYDDFGYDIEILDSVHKLDKNASGGLRDYAQGVYDGSQMFCWLIDQLKEETRPTYVIMFGDHAPALAENSLYYSKPTDAQLSKQQILNTQTTPFVFWSNTDREMTDFNRQSGFFLAGQILDALGLPRTDYLNLLANLNEHTAGFITRKGIVLDADGEWTTDTSEIDKLIDQLSYVQYDALWGKHFVFDETK